ncbi:hypothetical protein M8818_000831 [Zalaria obscura]|uniref:Uncharacterized protein n=1 Tax=Zalaria obscura TaxID=2024903 RepID=A0ACC3SPF5_9PEZI
MEDAGFSSNANANANTWDWDFPSLLSVQDMDDQTMDDIVMEDDEAGGVSLIEPDLEPAEMGPRAYSYAAHQVDVPTFQSTTAIVSSEEASVPAHTSAGGVSLQALSTLPPPALCYTGAAEDTHADQTAYSLNPVGPVQSDHDAYIPASPQEEYSSHLRRLSSISLRPTLPSDDPVENDLAQGDADETDRHMDLGSPHVESMGGLFIQQYPSAMPWSTTSALMEIAGDILGPPPYSQEDADDPRRDYDVVTFLDRWQYLPAMQSSQQVETSYENLQAWQPDSDVYSEDLPDTGRDIQGLEWSSIGTTRTTARHMRKALGPWINPHASRLSPYAHPAPPLTNSEHFYTFKRNHISHLPSYSHFQLRHTLSATSRNDIYYASNNRIQRTSLACPALSDFVLDLSAPSRSTSDFRITTLTSSPSPSFPTYASGSSDSYLIAGSFTGTYALHNLSTQQTHEGTITRAPNSITTHISIPPPHPSVHASPYALIASNDAHLRTLDLQTQTFTSRAALPASLNAAATSPDGRLRVVVGDMTEAVILDAAKGTVLQGLQGHGGEDAFCCAWAPDGVTVATGAQDGRVAVWDARNWARPVVRVDVGGVGCARSLVFTEGAGNSGGGASGQKLVVAEGEDVVSVFDCNDWSRRQDIEFFGAVAGCVVLEGGKEIVIANADRSVGGLMVFEQESDLGRCDWEGMLGGDEVMDMAEQKWVGKGLQRAEGRRTGGSVKVDVGDTGREDWPSRLGCGLEEVLI